MIMNMMMALLCLLLLARGAPVDAGVRAEISLDGSWEFRRDGESVERWRSVTVPSSFESHEGEGFDGIGWYRKSIEAPELKDGQRLLLHFDGVATRAEVWWDGVRLGEHLGAWTPFRFDVTTLVRGMEPGARHEVVLKADELVGHNTQGFLPVIAPHFGGLWRSVWLLVVPDVYFDDLRLAALGDPATRRLRIDAPQAGGEASGAVAFTVRLHDPVSGEWSSHELGATEQSIVLDEVRLWSPQSPLLYEVEAQLPPDAGGDLVRTRAAFRTVERRGEALFLNGAPLQVRGVLNWGFYPPFNHPNPPGAEAEYRRDLELARAEGFNLMKWCLWMPPRRYLELADELGMLGWVEYPTWHPDLSPARLGELRREFDELFLRDRAHPSVILRSLTCETGASADLGVIRSLYDLAHERIPGALVEDDSSWIEWQRVHDFYDDHPYGNNQTWVATLERLRRHIAAHGAMPLVLGEAIAADTWIPPERLQRALGEMRPFWAPRNLDASARWLERMRVLFGPGGIERLEEDSLRYALHLRKHQVELYRREVPTGGYVVSVVRDFSLAAMGLRTVFGEPKWAVGEWAWHGPTTLILSTPKDGRSFEGDGHLRAELLASSFEPTHPGELSLAVTLERGDEALATSRVAGIGLAPGAVTRLASIDFPLPASSRPERLALRARLEGAFVGRGAVESRWPIWVVPSAPPVGLASSAVVERDGALLASRLDPALARRLEAGARVLLVPDGEEGSLRLESRWFLRGGPYIPDHPLLEQVPRELLVDLQTLDLAGDVVPDLPCLEEVDPLFLLWDNHDRVDVGVHGLVFETRVGEGRLLVSALRHQGEENAAGRWLCEVFLRHLREGPVPRSALAATTWRGVREKLEESSISLADRVWRFRPDPRDEGLARGWQKPGAVSADEEGWKEIHIAKAWESEGYPALDGWAWYWLEVEVPREWEGRPVHLSFEGVDDIYELYVGGKLAGKGGDLATRVDAFNERKSHDITALAPAGKRVVLAVRVHDWQGAGGIFRPVTLGTVAFSAGSSLVR